jgi:molecular chaperone DnaJ
MKDPYKTLGVAHNASDNDIQKAYKKLVKQYHPDLHPNDTHAAKMMADINEAYDAITKNTREAQYYRDGGSEEGAARVRQQQQQQQQGYDEWPFGGYGYGQQGNAGRNDTNQNDPFGDFDPFEWFNTSSQQQTENQQKRTTVFWPGSSCITWIIAIFVINIFFTFLMRGCSALFS